MRKLVIMAAGLVLLLGVALLALNAGTSPNDAPQEPITIDLPDTFEN
ncbi:MAG: hypothetical protein V3U82_07310 [Robiginitomaculum sp.]